MPSTGECVICLSSLRDPSTLSCGHIFDKKCIERWLSTPGRDTCPLCNLVHITSATAASIQQLTPEIASQWPRTHVYLNYASDYDARKPYRLEVLDSKNLPQVPRYRGTAEHSRSFLSSRRNGKGGAVYTSEDKALIDIRNLEAQFLMMGNLIPKTFASRYGSESFDDWKATLSTLWAVLKQRDGQKLKARGLAGELYKKVYNSIKIYPRQDDTGNGVYNVERELMAPFFNHDSTSCKSETASDFDLLLDYVVHAFVEAYKFKKALTEREKQAEAERKAEKQRSSKVWTSFGRSKGR